MPSPVEPYQEGRQKVLRSYCTNIYFDLRSISNIQFLTFLRTLTLTSNFVLEELPNGLFKFNPELKKLNFAKNNIKSLFSNTLEGLENLEEILIGNNPIKDIPNGFFSKAENLR